MKNTNGDIKKIYTASLKHDLKKLCCGDIVSLSGRVFTARDAAHKLLCEAQEQGQSLPFSLESSIVFYVGPSPAKPDEPIGSCGPTSSIRMEDYAPALIYGGISGIIGKGQIGENTKSALKKTQGIYFLALGGVAALTKKCVKSAKVIAYPHLGCEAVHELEVENLLLIVGQDILGNNIFSRC